MKFPLDLTWRNSENSNRFLAVNGIPPSETLGNSTNENSHRESRDAAAHLNCAHALNSARRPDDFQKGKAIPRCIRTLLYWL